jgi:hypothetical protein
MSESELNDWRDLVQSPGWARLSEYVAQEWGLDEASGVLFRQAVRNVADDPNDAGMAAKLRQVLAAQKAVQTLMQVPAHRLAALKQPPGHNPDHQGRRGAL